MSKLSNILTYLSSQFMHLSAIILALYTTCYQNDSLTKKERSFEEMVIFASRNLLII